jgi:hypothetical protein
MVMIEFSHEALGRLALDADSMTSNLTPVLAATHKIGGLSSEI